jgi:hypothetical protein
MNETSDLIIRPVIFQLERAFFFSKNTLRLFVHDINPLARLNGDEDRIMEYVLAMSNRIAALHLEPSKKVPFITMQRLSFR